MPLIESEWGADKLRDSGHRTVSTLGSHVRHLPRGTAHWRPFYVLYGCVVAAIAAVSVMLLLTFVREVDDISAANMALWELNEAERGAMRLVVAVREFRRTGNWLVLHAALNPHIIETTASVSAYLERRHSREIERLAWAEATASALETSATYALALHLKGIGILDQVGLPRSAAVALEPEDEEATGSELSAKAVQTLTSAEFNGGLEQFSGLIKSLADHILRESLTMSARRVTVARGCAFLLVALAAAGVVLLFHVRHLQRQGEEFSKAIVELGERLGAAGSVREAAEAFLAAADRLLGWDAAGVSLLDRERGVVRDVLWYDTIDGQKQEIPATEVERAQTALSRRVARGESFLFLSPVDGLGARAFGDTSRRSQSSIFVPIRRGDEVVGFATVQSYRPYAYTEDGRALLMWLAARIGAALERASLIEQVQRSEEQYRLLVETSLDGVAVLDLEHFYFVNKAFARMFGYDSPEELVGSMRPVDLFSPHDRDRMCRLLSARLRGEGGSAPHRGHALRKDGTEIIFESLASPTEFQGRRAVLGTVRDVTDREKARAELETVHRIYQQAIEAAGAVPYRLDFQSGRYEFPSEAIESLTGFSRDELTRDLFASRVSERQTYYPAVDADRIAELEELDRSLPPEEVERREHLRQLLSGEANLYRAEYRFERKDGRFVWLLDSSVIEEDETGRPIGSYGILQDITASKRLQRRTEVFMSLTGQLAAATTAREGALIFLEHARRLFEFDTCAVALYDRDHNCVVPIYAEDTVGGERQEVDLPDEISDTARRVLAGEPVLILRKDPEEDAEAFRPFGDVERRSLSIMMAPLRRGDKVLGLVLVESYHANAYTAEDLEDLRAMAEHCAAGIEGVLLFQRLAESEEQLRALWMTAPIGIRLTDAEGIVWLTNPAYCQLMELTEQDIIGKPYTAAYAAEDRDEVLRLYRERFANQAIEKEFEHEIVLWNGKKKTVQVMSRYLNTSTGTMLLSIVADRTREHQLTLDLMEKQKELEQLATHDPLTGLKNRRLALELMEHELERARRYRLPLAVLMLDIDQFKEVNDTYGHLVGDEVLRQFGQILSSNSRSVDIVARYGGEEFLVVMPETGLNGALVFAERVRKAVEKHPFRSRDNIVVHITCSVGVAQGEPDSLDEDTLLSRADKALYRAKREGRNRVSAA
jgi:diguanylate cyclase (GGDEF)-like protein/PAS domain S-box-containing protein